jgi:hypothetical protein
MIYLDEAVEGSNARNGGSTMGGCLFCMKDGKISEDRRRRRNDSGLIGTPPGERGFGFYVLKKVTEALIGFKNLEIIDKVASNEGKEHKGEDYLSCLSIPGWDEDEDGG